MPRYFTHLEDHNGFSPDEEGTIFPGVSDAVRHAGRAAGSMLGEDLEHGRSPARIRLFLDDEQGVRHATIRVDAQLERASAEAQPVPADN